MHKSISWEYSFSKFYHKNILIKKRFGPAKMFCASTCPAPMFSVLEDRQYHYKLDVMFRPYLTVLLDFSLSVKVASLIFISGCGSAISFAKEGKSGFIYNLVKSL